MRNLQFTKRNGRQKLRTFAAARRLSPYFSSAKPLHVCGRMTPPIYQSYGQDIRDRTFEFACEIVFFCDDLFNGRGAARALASQLVRCGTSIGANLEEARGGESRRDFVSKCSIALKEARETHFRLRVAVRCRLGPRAKGETLAKEAGEIAAILGAIVRNARRKAKSKGSA